jgi:hypothetical protein
MSSPNPIKVYVAGAYADRERVQNMFKQIRESPCLELEHDWLALIDSVKAPDEELTDAEASHYAWGDLSRIEESDVVLFLVPPKDLVGRGCWTEFGFALGCRFYAGRNDPRVIASGNLSTSIFTRAPDDYFSTDVEAFLHLEKLGDERWQEAKSFETRVNPPPPSSPPGEFVVVGEQRFRVTDGRGVPVSPASSSGCEHKPMFVQPLLTQDSSTDCDSADIVEVHVCSECHALYGVPGLLVGECLQIMSGGVVHLPCRSPVHVFPSQDGPPRCTWGHVDPKIERPRT